MPALAVNTPLFHFSSHSDDNDTVEVFDDDERQDLMVKGSRPKMSGACVDCKSVKVRCEPVPGERKCRRCQVKDLPCRSRERKKRKPADTHEELQQKAHDQDVQIQDLLLQYDKLKADHKIRQWMSRSLPLTATDEHESQERAALCVRWIQRGKSPESAVAMYFAHGSSDYIALPEIVKHCSLYPEEILELFSIFFKRINPYFSILDEDLHTPHNLIWTSPFLFTVICAVSARYYTARPGIYGLAMDFARDAAGKALVEGRRSVDMCQAYLLMAVYPVPKKKWVEDRSWLLMGVAIRMALELKLDQVPSATCAGRESLNRVRTWLNCYCVDGSHAIQFGKMPMLRLDDYLARSSANWYRSSSMNTPFDVHLCAYVQIIIIMAEWRAIINASLKESASNGSDIVEAAIRTQEKLARELGQWVKAYAQEFIFMPLPICSYRGNTTQMITAYLQLVVLSTGFQSAVKSGISRDSEIFTRSLDAARAVIQIMVERLAPTGYLCYAMDANFLYVSYAAAFLINLLRPKFIPLLDDRQQKEIILTVTHLINVLGSRDVALDGRHTPALYSRFLSSLLNKYYPTSRLSEYCSSTGDVKCSPEAVLWPDVEQLPASEPTRILDNFSSGMVYQHQGEADMDFSLNHFVKTVTQDLPAHSGNVELMEATESWRGWDDRSEQSFAWSNSCDFPAWRES